ncbi:Piso0_000004 [Millerozyma farinosa CBS 7064]|uniref:Piso0_000004 protein n=1 Tax=Pichia sorbitophila (strain ATCC MYA-4447 / BCRC 22081 / CBS 7064 / NBRC 10061 / NRRL Y-12695) TaxID=559304 RepID=G8YUA4_PICSO|nr:Piso0_000004 [Millerozyma farinosa CBS 7064]
MSEVIHEPINKLRSIRLDNVQGCDMSTWEKRDLMSFREGYEYFDSMQFSFFKPCPPQLSNEVKCRGKMILVGRYP